MIDLVIQAAGHANGLTETDSRRLGGPDRTWMKTPQRHGSTLTNVWGRESHNCGTTGPKSA